MLYFDHLILSFLIVQFGSNFIQLSFYVDPTILHLPTMVSQYSLSTYYLEPHTLAVIMMTITAILFIEYLLHNNYCTKHFTCNIWLNSHKGSSYITEKETKTK